jgi:hypothetical protein
MSSSRWCSLITASNVRLFVLDLEIDTTDEGPLLVIEDARATNYELLSVFQLECGLLVLAVLGISISLAVVVVDQICGHEHLLRST